MVTGSFLLALGRGMVGRKTILCHTGIRYIIADAKHLEGHSQPKQYAYGWVSWLFLYAVPIVLWAYPFNQLDTLMAFFTLLAIRWGVLAIQTERPPYWILCGFGCFLAFVAKGPVGVFPLGMPLLSWLVFRKKNFTKSLLDNLIVITSFVGFMVALWLYEPALNYLQHFLDQQLFSALAGKREGGEDPLNRLYIFQQIAMQNASLVTLSAIVWLFGRTKVSTSVSPWVVFFVVLGLMGSLPIAISPKQHEIYLIPAATCFSLATAWFVLPYVAHWATIASISVTWFQRLRVLMWALIVGVCVYSYTEIRKPGREVEVLTDMPQLAQHIPDRVKVGVCATMMADFVVHGYLQRYHHWELTSNVQETPYFLTQADCGQAFEQTLQTEGFRSVPLVTQRFRLWKR